MPAAAGKAKPGRSQRKKKAEREAMLSQQTAVPTSNQRQIVSPSQPAPKAVQSSVVAAGVGTQPPLVELNSVETTTAAELVVTPGASLAISWLQQHLSCVLLYHCLPCATVCVCEV